MSMNKNFTVSSIFRLKVFGLQIFHFTELTPSIVNFCFNWPTMQLRVKEVYKKLDAQHVNALYQI